MISLLSSCSVESDSVTDTQFSDYESLEIRSVSRIEVFITGYCFILSLMLDKDECSPNLAKTNSSTVKSFDSDSKPSGMFAFMVWTVVGWL